MWFSRFKVTLLVSVFFVSIPFICMASEDNAMVLFKRGVKQYDSGDFVGAAKTFKKAYEAKSSWKMLYNIGQAEAAARRYGIALDAFEAYLVDGGDDVILERHNEVLVELARLRLLVGVVEVKAENGTELFIDGESRGTVPLDRVIRVAAKKHQVVLKKNGVVLYDKAVRFAGGSITMVATTGASNTNVLPQLGNSKDESDDTVKVESDNPAVKDESNDAVSEKTYSSSSSKKESKALRVSGIILTASSVGVLGMGIAFTVKSNNDYDDYSSAMNEYKNNPTIENKNSAEAIYNNEVTTSDTMKIVGFVSAGVLLSAGVALLIVDSTKRKKRESLNLSVAPSGLQISF